MGSTSIGDTMEDIPSFEKILNLIVHNYAPKNLRDFLTLTATLNENTWDFNLKLEVDVSTKVLTEYYAELTEGNIENIDYNMRQLFSLLEEKIDTLPEGIIKENGKYYKEL